MSEAWDTVRLAVVGGAVGAAAGWLFGLRYRGRPLAALIAIVAAFGLALYSLWLSREMGERWVSTAGIAAGFGAMTALKYSSGLLLGAAGAAGDAAQSVAADAATDAATGEEQPGGPLRTRPQESIAQRLTSSRASREVARAGSRHRRRLR